MPKQSATALRFFNLLWDTFGQSFFGRLFFKISATYQIRPNQSTHIGILHFTEHSLRAYQRNQVSRTNGSWDNTHGKSKIWKMAILGFLDKWPSGPPSKVKNQFLMVFLVDGDPNSFPKTFSSIFGTGCRKASTLEWYT